MSCHLMACLSWSPSSLPGGVIGAREQPHRGPNNEDPTVDPALAATLTLEVDRCLVDGIGIQRSMGCASSLTMVQSSRDGWLGTPRVSFRRSSPSSPSWAT